MDGGGQTQVTKTDPWGPQQDPLIKGFDRAESDILNGPLPWAPLDWRTEVGLNRWMDAANDPYGYMNQSYNMLQDTASGNYMYGPLMDQNMDYVMSSVMPTVDSRFALSNRMGSGIHGEKLGEGVALGMTPYMNMERDRMMGAAQMAPMMEQAMHAPYLMAGDMYRQNEMDRLNAPYNQLAQYMSLISGDYGGTATGTTSMEQDPLMAGLGYGSLLAGMLGPWGFGLFSDRRLKTNIKRVGETPSGIPLYTWTYIWGAPGFGVMADEVPHLAFTHPSGFMMVDYSRLT